jgi:hypothetical protein
MELLGALLDVLDAIAGAFGLATLWVTWVRPRRSQKPAACGEPADIDRFLDEASARGGGGGTRA